MTPRTEAIHLSADTDNARDIAAALVEARHAALALADYPGARPPSLAAAYAIQDEAIRLSGRRVAGWKVGRINPPIDGFDRLGGPIFADQIVDANADPVAMPVIRGGFAAAEAEFLLRIGTAPDPAQRHYTHDEARALIDAVHVGIEIAGSPYAGINRDGPLVTISDFGNNNGLVVGPAIDGWREMDLNAVPVELHVNDARIGAGAAATMLDGPWGAACFLFQMAAARGIVLSPGQWISSGAVTGVHEVAIGDRIAVRFGDTLGATCAIVAQHRA